MTPPTREGPRINEFIDAPEIRLIDADGEQAGVVSTVRGMELADEAGLDLVEISPHAAPPVCKLLDYGKYKFEAQKKAATARKKQKVIDIKEVKFRPGIDEADYLVKLRNIRRFLSEGDKVKITMRFRGREMVHQELGTKVLMRVRDDVEELGKVEQMPRTEGRQMTMVLNTR
jgi:translation initiation factor IF-3